VNPKERLARDATMAALRLRTSRNKALDVPICPFDMAENLGVTVHLQALPSLEGMYTPNGPTIVVGGLRPPGRRAFTCAHELGHHVLGHGVSFDELVQDTNASGDRGMKEFAADRFAAALLMPKMAVQRAFSSRGWDPAHCTPQQVYVVAGYLGVGYTTLIGYLSRTLHLLSGADARTLEQVRLPSIRAQLLGSSPTAGLLVVDLLWTARPVDVSTGDVVVLPANTSIEEDGPLIIVEADDRVVIARAARAGIAAVSSRGWSAQVRVSRADFGGLAIYRHLEDHEDEH
jgi:Zn-dependent peptidase ImmA (M78 family)